MKLSLALVLFPAAAFGAAPFTVSGAKIAALFDSPMLWQKVGGSVETIVDKGATKDGLYVMAVTTTEYVPIIDPSGVTVGYNPTPCMVVVSLREAGIMGGKWTVEKADFTACPKTALSR